MGDIETNLAQAIELHARGELSAAKALYDKVLAAAPTHAEALHRLAVLAMQAGHAAAGEQLLRRAIAAEPNRIAAYDHLAQTLRARGEVAGAAACYRQVVARWPTSAEAHHNLSLTLAQLSRLDESAAAAAEAARLRPDSPEMRYNLACRQRDFGNVAAAADELRETLRLAPEHAEATYLLAALSGQCPTAAPRDYVAKLFDRYADQFERHVSGPLAYRVPQLMVAAVGRVGGAGKTYSRVLDLGCGTGLCGSLVRKQATHLAGVDLAPRMIELASRRKVYDELHVHDAVEALRADVPPWRLILAADVLVYLGDLDPLFEAASRALARGGLFAFSTETCPGDAYQLLPTARFAHSSTYIESLAARHGFAVRESAAIVVRVERKVPLAGQLFVLSARGQ